MHAHSHTRVGHGSVHRTPQAQRPAAPRPGPRAVAEPTGVYLICVWTLNTRTHTYLTRWGGLGRVAGRALGEGGGGA